MLTGYQIWDNKTDKIAGYATVKHDELGSVIDIEVINCTLRYHSPETWVATACKICNESEIDVPIAGVIFYYDGGTITVSECTPF